MQRKKRGKKTKSNKIRIIEQTKCTVADNIISSLQQEQLQHLQLQQTTEMILNECGSFFLQGFVTGFISYLVWLVFSISSFVFVYFVNVQ